MAVASAPALPSYLLKGNDQFPTQVFQSLERVSVDYTPYPIGLDTDEQIRGFTARLWEKASKAIEPEQDRMRRAQLYYDGYHYESPADNMNNEITNYPFSVVETIWPQLVEGKPRPEIQAGVGFDDRHADDLQAWATWLMNTTGFDQCHRLGSREFLKLGWVNSLVAFDPRTGMPYPKLWCNWDYYPDPTARHEDDAMFHILAAPVPTALLRAMFPGRKIMPDHWVSPSYDALIRPAKERAAFSGYQPSGANAAPHVVAYPNASPATTTFFTPPRGVYEQEGGDTTFLIQLFFRDQSQMQVAYAGKRFLQRGDGSWVWHWDTLAAGEPVCSSGWRVIQMTARGEILDVSPLDDCYWGLPFTIWRDYEQAFRFAPVGEIDNIIPKTRAVNRRLNLLNMALEYQANPVALLDRNSGIRLDKGAIFAGEALVRNQGTKVEWMEVRGPVEQQFALLQRESADVEMLSGAYDASRGERPPGVEAGIAIERLQSAADRRTRAKEPGMFAHYSLLLKKLMTCALMKLNRRIQFRATNGRLVTIDPQDITGEFGISFAQGTGVSASRQDRTNQAVNLFQIGAIDRDALLKSIEWPEGAEVAARMAQQEMMKAQMEAEVAAKNAPPGGKSQREAA